MILISENEARIMADLLELAADEFGNHGCNDFELAITDENRELIKAMYADVLDEHDLEIPIHNGNYVENDSCLMQYLANKLNNLIESERKFRERGE